MRFLPWNHPSSLLIRPPRTNAPFIIYDFTALPQAYFPLQVHFLSSLVTVNTSNTWFITTASTTYAMELQRGVPNRFSYFGQYLSEGSVFGAELYFSGASGTFMQGYFMSYQQVVDFLFSPWSNFDFITTFQLPANQLVSASLLVTNPISDIYYLLLVFADSNARNNYQHNGTRFRFWFNETIHNTPTTDQLLQSCTLTSPGICRSSNTPNPPFVLLQSLLPPSTNVTFTPTRTVFVI